MTPVEKNVLDKFKFLLLKRLKVRKMILFGSRARGGAGPYSDMDIVVVLDNSHEESDFDYVSDCAWAAGFEQGIVI
ncbi:MAG: nucleotidyltransferase domain-containing protein, partial [Nitrospiraceae bacterium]|nr:nucleotidyltransferase domain-containing protein [Nitrospiraceae bacterium]